MSFSHQFSHLQDNQSSQEQGESSSIGTISTFQSGIQKAQETIYHFLFKQVRNQPPLQVLEIFQYLFIQYQAPAHHQEILKAITTLLLSKQEEEFRYTLKRSCYILVNNWISTRKTVYIQELIQIFEGIKQRNYSDFYILKRLQLWLHNFLDIQDYQELKLFTAQYLEPEFTSWSESYAPYLLTAQYYNHKNPQEQREAAKKLAQKLHYQFKFALVKYTAHLQSPIQQDMLPKNPTILGEEILRFIKAILSKNGTFSCRNIAHIFLEQTQGILYKDFKSCLSKYLIFSVEDQRLVTLIQQRLIDKLNFLYQEHEQEQVNQSLKLRTCKQILNYFTTENQKEPSELFVFCLSQGYPLVLVHILLKTVLIAPEIRTYLETQIAYLVDYYSKYSVSECAWAIKFFEIFRITFAIHTDNVQYNLIRVKNSPSGTDCSAMLDGYRIFSQYRGEYVG